MNLLLHAWMIVLVFCLALNTGIATPVFVALVSLGFFGLDQVAEILESPRKSSGSLGLGVK